MTPAWWFMLVVDVALVIWLYRSVKREEDALEAEEPQQAELQEEMDAYNESRALRIHKGSTVDPLPRKPRTVMHVPTIPVQPEEEWQQRARRAEALGFMDGDDVA